MNKSRNGTLFSILVLAVAAWVHPVAGQTATNAASAGPASFSSEVAAVTAQLKQKFDAGEIGQTNLAENIKAIHELILKHQKDADRQQLSRLYLLDAHIQADGLKDAAKAREIWKYVAWAFPGTPAAQGAKLCMARADAELAAKPVLPIPEAAAPGSPEVGKLAPNFAATDIDGKAVSLGDLRGKIVVMESFYVGCPFCEHHYKSGAMHELQQELSTNGVVWLLIDFTGPTIQTPAAVKQERADRNMVITDWIVDADRQIARTYAMRTAPHMFVIDKRGVLAYQGAIDDQPSPNGDPRTARNYVREAVHALLAGKDVAVSETKPYGCHLQYAGMPDEQMFTPPAFLLRR